MVDNKSREVVDLNGRRFTVKGEGFDGALFVTDGEMEGVLKAGQYSEVESDTRRSIGQLTVDLDCSEALTGLKALQREARKATQALRELEECAKATGSTTNMGASYIAGISGFSTKELVAELARREGAIEIAIEPHSPFEIRYKESDYGYVTHEESGPARVLVVTD